MPLIQQISKAIIFSSTITELQLEKRSNLYLPDYLCACTFLGLIYGILDYYLEKVPGIYIVPFTITFAANRSFTIYKTIKNH